MENLIISPLTCINTLLTGSIRLLIGFTLPAFIDRWPKNKRFFGCDYRMS